MNEINSGGKVETIHPDINQIAKAYAEKYGGYAIEMELEGAFIAGYQAAKTDAVEVINVLKEMVSAFHHIGGIGRDEKKAAQDKALNLIKKLKEKL